MRKIKLLFIFVVAFSSALCFADAKEEEAELNVAILDPIINHFPEGSSYTRIMSKKIVEYEVANEKQFTPEDAFGYMKKMEAEMKDNSSVEVGSGMSEYICAWEALEKVNEMDYAKGFVANYLAAWQNKLIQCYGYARLALVAFYFNKMNDEARGVKMFKEAVIVETYETSYGHVFILVEGVSGTMFAIDPWMRKVIVLDNFIKLSGIKTDGINYKYLEDKYNKQLNSLFATKGKSGLLYYDALYVDYNTNWRLSIVGTNKIRTMVKSNCSSIDMLYDALRYNAIKQKGFPRWQSDYSDLVKPKGSGCSVQ